MTLTAVSNAVIPSVFSAYLQALTEVKSRLVQSGALARDPEMDALLAGGGKTFNLPGWQDLADTAANVSIGSAGSAITPLNLTSRTEVGVRMSRNQAWGAVDLVRTLAGDDPMQRIAARVAPYWTRQAQLMCLATMAGVFADNDANDAGDYTHDISDTYSAGVTDFSAEAFIDAIHTMGDSEADLGVVIMHSVVYAKAKKNNLIDFVSDAVNGAAASMPTFLGRQVLVDDGMPVATQDYETWILGAGALRWGVGTPPVPVETYRLPLDAAGGGSDSLITRVEWMLHPTGHAYAGTAPDGGPSNASSANNLAAAASWNRVASERKQVKIARLITTEA
jgi:hypothetical protein